MNNSSIWSSCTNSIRRFSQAINSTQCRFRNPTTTTEGILGPCWTPVPDLCSAFPQITKTQKLHLLLTLSRHAIKQKVGETERGERVISLVSWDIRSVTPSWFFLSFHPFVCARLHRSAQGVSPFIRTKKPRDAHY